MTSAPPRLVVTGFRVALAALVLAGCKSKPAPEAAPPPAPLAADADGFIVARPTVTAAAPPAAFAAPLPASEAELAQGPPTPFVEATLGADQADMRARLLTAATRAAAAGEVPPRLRERYVDLLHGAGPGACGWMVATATGTAPLAVRAVFWAALDRCEGPAVAAAMERDDAPDQAVIDWWFEQSLDHRAPFSPRAARAAATVVRSPDDLAARKVGFAFAAMDGPDALPALLALQGTIADPHRRALIVVGMIGADDDTGRAVGLAACRDAVVATDPMCAHDDDDDTGAPPPPPATLDDQVADGEVDAALAAHPRADVIAALVRCTGRADRYAPDRCLRALAGLDRAAARAAAAAMRGGDPEARAALAAFADVAALDQALDALGFTAAPGAPPPPAPPLTVADALVARGRTTAVDTETDQWPNQHDRVLAALAALAAPALDGVLFAEEAPAMEDQTSPYVLHAFADGKDHALRARNLGDWYDVEAVVGLLNALLVERGRPWRYVVLPTGDQTAVVAVGPAAGWRSLLERRLLTLAAPGDGAANGKAFEDQVFDRLERQSPGQVQRGVPVR